MKQRVTTKFTVSMVTGEVLEHEYFWYDGPVALCKGDDTAKQQEQQQLQFNTQLMDIFGKQFANQTQTLNYLKGKLQPMIDKPTGYSPEDLAAMRTGATDNLSSEYQNARKTLQNTQAIRSGDLPSGVNSQLTAGLLSSEASDKAGAQSEITQKDADLKESNYWGAINALNGNAVEQNPLGYAGAYNSGSGNVASLSKAVTDSQNSGLLGSLVGAGAGVGSSLITKYCYVAAAVFHEDFFTGEKTNIVRDWLYNDWSKNWFARPILWLYSKVGRRVAQIPTLVRLATPLFNAALRRAQENKCLPILNA